MKKPGDLYDKTDPMSIYEYSKQLLDLTLYEWVSQSSNNILKDSASNGYVSMNKGDLGQSVEKYFFGYEPNNSPLPDFPEAKVELKCTGLKKTGLKSSHPYDIKERLVCDLINYMQDGNVKFEDSKFYIKCSRMLILFYLYENGVKNWDYRFLKVALWKIPTKDLLIIKKDYETIVGKILSGKAHELSESDSMYLAACRKGSGGDKDLRRQPYSDILAKQRAFSLKPAYMRTILQYINASNGKYATNFVEEGELPELVSVEELKTDSFENILLERFRPYYGMNYIEISKALSKPISVAKHKYAMVATEIVRPKHEGKIVDIQDYDELKKSGITVKTIRLQYNGVLKEAMSFENIDYEEIYSNDKWEDSRLYEIFTTKFLFVLFVESKDGKIDISGHIESEYLLKKAFFWTMPEDDLSDAQLYWQNIRQNVLADNIRLDAFYKSSDKKKFHVRPKGTKESYKGAAVNPHGGMADKYCYWLNRSYVEEIIRQNS